MKASEIPNDMLKYVIRENVLYGDVAQALAQAELDRRSEAKPAIIGAGAARLLDVELPPVRYRKANIGDPIPCLDCGAIHEGGCVNTNEAKDKPEQHLDECPLCKVRGWIDSCEAWGNRKVCRACKGTFYTEAPPAKPEQEEPWLDPIAVGDYSCILQLQRRSDEQRKRIEALEDVVKRQAELLVKLTK